MLCISGLFIHFIAELDMDWIHPWIGLDWIWCDDCDPPF